MYLLDSNIIIDFLNGDKKIGNWMNKEKSIHGLFSFAISKVGRIEVLSDKRLTEKQAMELEKFLDLYCMYCTPFPRQLILSLELYCI